MTTHTSVAHPNIALAKYWGKRPFGHNLPAVPSLSVTLAGMSTVTHVTLADDLPADVLELDGKPVVGRPVERVTQLLDLLVDGAPRPRARVASRNDFPTAAGLASSASAFAALSVAGNAALATGHDPARLSCMARRVSASAGRSLFGGFVVLPAGREGQTALPAEPLAPADHWDLRLVVAVTTEGAKDVGSTEGMNRTSETSPLYAGWLRSAPEVFETCKRAVLERDFAALGPAMEESALCMHATALAARPGLLYWNGVTVEVMRTVRALRKEGLSAYFTIDAGPHVKVVCGAADVEAVAARL
ncbi:MAG TPA: diphosphomevalonate decarboxylase, partial [Gemmatimonadales bacterium]|nr:diphosphomevalonate decarboxylase [Gemmatimonadales bacterium]